MNSKPSALLMNKLQEFHAAWLQNTFPKNTADDQFEGMVEELGELARAKLKNSQGMAHFPDDAAKLAIEDAIGDLFFYMLGFCSKRGIRISDCIDVALREFVTRDWKHYVATGEKRYEPLPSWLDPNTNPFLCD